MHSKAIGCCDCERIKPLPHHGHGSREPIDGWHLDRSRTCRHHTLAVARARRQTKRGQKPANDEPAPHVVVSRHTSCFSSGSDEPKNLGVDSQQLRPGRHSSAVAQALLVSCNAAAAAAARLVWRWEEGNRICRILLYTTTDRG